MTKKEIKKNLKQIEKEVSNVDFWLAYCDSVTKLIEEKQQLIKYLEDEIEYRQGSEYDVEIDERHILEVVLDKVKSGEYE